MVFTCCVSGCNNNSAKKKSTGSLSFHAFPSKPQLRKKWLRAIGRPYWSPPSSMRVCSAHFKRGQVVQEGTKARIKEDSCPVEDLPFTNTFSASDVEVCRICLDTDCKLFSLEYGKLKVCMEALAELNDKNNILDLPQFVCYECGMHLLKYHKLIEKSLIAQATLLDIFADNGRITKRLVKQTDRKKLNLQSSLGYSKLIAIHDGDVNKASLDDSADNDDDIKVDVCKDEFDNAGESIESSEKKEIRINTCKYNINRNDDNHTITSASKQSNTKDISPNNLLNENVNKKQINIELKSEVITLDSETIDFKTEVVAESIIVDSIDDVNENGKQTFKAFTKKQVAKKMKTEIPEKVDSSDTDCLKESSRRSKNCNKKLKNASNSKSKSTEYCDVSKLNTDTDELNDIFESLNEVLDSNSSCDDDAINFEDLSGSGSDSDDEDLQTLKMNALLKKLKQNSKIPRKRARPRKKKDPAEKSPEDAALEKLKCYKITDISLQDQIDVWKSENKEPMQYSQFECEVCNRKFVRKKAYEEHLPRHDMSRGDFECPVCKERFRNETRFNSHTVRNHAKKYECQKCEKVFYNLDKAQRHESFHSGQVYKCPHCAFSTTHRSTAWEHVRSQHAHAHHCARCGHTFINAKGLGTHTAMTHPGEEGEPETPFPCEECNIVFHSEGALRVHRMVYIQHKDQPKAPGEPPPKPTCRRCGAIFARKRELWAHTQSEHRHAPRLPRPRARAPPGDVVYPRPCDHCNTELKSRFEHWCHVRREHPEHKHLYRSIVTAVCATCGKGFQNKTMLTRHEQKHRGPATLTCTLCPRAFHDQYSLSKHVRSHAPERPFACRECGRAFKVKGNMERHRRYAHAPESPFLCTDCGRAFNVKSNFKRHLRMHTGETPYECKYCGKKFRYWESLTLHEKHMHQKVPWPTRDRSGRAKRQAAKDDSAEEV